MAEQPLATDKTAQASISELKKISAVLSADQKVSEKLASDTKDTKTGTEKIATSATTFTKILSDMKGLQETAMALAERARKAALRMASKIDPSKYMKAMADKTKKFAGDLLSLLLKGGILMGLALLLKWLATQDWEKWWNEWGPKIKKKWEEFKTMFTNFYNDYKKIIDAISVISALAAVWKAADWLKKATSPIVLLMGALLKIFAVTTGSIALLLVEVTAWVGKKLFAVGTGTLSKLWGAIKLLFGGTGTIFKLFEKVTEWVGKGLFKVGTGALSLLWKEIIKIFGASGSILKLVAKVTEWVSLGLFKVGTGALSLLWKEIIKIFGVGGTILTLVAKVTGWVTLGLFKVGTGALSLLWKEIIKIFGASGTILKLVAKVTEWVTSGLFKVGTGALSLLWKEIIKIWGAKGSILTLYNTVTDWVKTTMFGENGSLHKLWKAIKGFFGIGGKLATSAGFLLTAEEMIDLKFAGLHKDGPLQKMWKAIKGFFGPGGKIAEMLKVIKILPLPTWFDEGGKIRTFWTFIKNIFGPAGKIQDMIKVLGTVPTWFDEGGKFRTFWTFIKGVFGPAGKIAEMVKTIKITPLPNWFDESGEFRKLWKFIKGVFGPTGAIKHAVDAVAETADWFNDRHDLIRLYNWMRGLFSKTGVIGKFFTTIGMGTDAQQTAQATSWFGEGSKLRKMFTWFTSLFGADSALGKFVGTLGGWVDKFKAWFPDSIKTTATKGATGIAGFFEFIGDIVGKIGKFTKAMFDNPIVKAIRKFFGFVGGKALGVLGVMGKFFAPIGWIMAVIEGMMGFWEGFKSKGEDDTRTMNEKMMDGLKGAMKALVDFFVIDMIQMVESMINWAIRQINAFAGDTWGLQWMKMKEINISQSIKESMHGIIDDIMGGDVLDTTFGAAGWLKKNQAMAMESLVGKGIGTYDKENKSFTLNSSALIKMMETMKPEEMAKMMKEIKMTENLSGVTQDWMGNYKNWEDMNAGLWKHLALKKSAAEYEALAKGYTDKMTFLNDINNTVSSGGVYVTNVSSVDQSKAIQAYTSANTVF